MGHHHSKPPAPDAPWAQISEGGSVTKVYVYPKDTADTLYGISTNHNHVFKKPINSGVFTDTNDADTGFLAIDGAQMYKVSNNLRNVSSAESSGNGNWRMLSIGYPLFGLTLLDDTVYTCVAGVLHSAPSKGGPLTAVPSLGNEGIIELCATGGNIYGTDGRFLYALTSPTSGPWMKMTSALPSGVTNIKSICANSTRVFVVGSDSYVYGTC